MRLLSYCQCQTTNDNILFWQPLTGYYPLWQCEGERSVFSAEKSTSPLPPPQPAISQMEKEWFTISHMQATQNRYFTLVDILIGAGLLCATVSCCAAAETSANHSPAAYERFSRPFHDLVFQRHGGGGLHNCGPNPCLEGYLSHAPPIRALDLSYKYSKGDFPRMKRALKKRAFVYLCDLPAEPNEAIEAYRRIMEQMAPDVIVVPHLIVPLDREPGEVCRRMREIADEYARRMDWGWEV